MPGKADIIRSFKYSPWGKELKAQTSAAEKQYQKLEKVFKSKKEEKVKRIRATSDLVCSNDFSFYKYCHTKKIAKRCICSKRNDLPELKGLLELLHHDTKELKPNNEDQEKDLEKRKIVIEIIW